MNLNNLNLQFSRKDVIKKIKIPQTLNLKLAHLIGIHLGDGSMVYTKEKHDYWISYSGNLTEEYDWYMGYLIPLLGDLFNIKVTIQEDRRPKRTMIRIFFRSKAILKFLHKNIDLPLGNKKGCGIPKTIKRANTKIKKRFLRGLADTEFSLHFSKRKRDGKHTYPTIAYGTSNTKLAKSINLMLIQLGFKTYSRFNFSAWRYDTPLIGNYLSLNGVKNLEKWMKEIGFSSPKHLTKYQVWKKFGYCPANTNINQRRSILSGEIAIGSFY